VGARGQEGPETRARTVAAITERDAGWTNGVFTKGGSLSPCAQRTALVRSAVSTWRAFGKGDGPEWDGEGPAGGPYPP